jgi:uncharacterized protein YxeA
MKKPVVFAIVCIYILAIVIVGVFGVKLQVYDQVIYASQVECKYLLLDQDTINLVYDNDTNKYNISRYDSSLNRNVMFLYYKENTKFSIYYDIYPDNTTTKSAKVTVSNDTLASVNDENGIVSVNNLTPEFIASGKKWLIFSVHVTATDGSDIDAEVNITFKIQQSTAGTENY